MYGYIGYLANDDYLLGLLILNKSLKKVNSIYKLYCLISPEVSYSSIKEIEKNDIQIIRHDLIDFPENIFNYHKKYYQLENEESIKQKIKNYYNKLRIFNLTQFEKIVYIDLDMFVLKNIDHLFDNYYFAATENHTENDKKYFSSAIMLIKPSNVLYEEILNYLYNLKEDTILKNSQKDIKVFWDQDFLNLFFYNWDINKDSILPYSYNIFASFFDFYKLNEEDVYVIHMAIEKFWNISLEKMLYNFLEKNNEFFIYKTYLELFQEIFEDNENKSFIENYINSDFFNNTGGHPWKQTYKILDYLKNNINIKNGALEIGVQEGKFFIGINSIVPSNSESYIIDIFEKINLTVDNGAKSFKKRVIDNLQYDINKGKNVKIIESDSANSAIYRDIKNCSIISIDGAHNVEYVINDLKMTSAILDDEGIIIVDDFQWPKWISVVEGVVKFLEINSIIAPFAFGFNKLYLCKISQHKKYLNLMINFPLYYKEITKFCGQDIVYLWENFPI